MMSLMKTDNEVFEEWMTTILAIVPGVLITIRRPQEPRFLLSVVLRGRVGFCSLAWSGQVSSCR
jgi:hypothetical protein